MIYHLETSVYIHLFLLAVFSIVFHLKDLSSEYTLKISYMEIYNEIGYDLLDSRHNNMTSKLEDLP